MALAAYHSAAFNKASGLSVAAGAQVEVRKESDGTLAALKQDRAGSLAASNPLTADASGRFSFYVAADSAGFQIKVTDSDANTLTLNNVAIGLLGEKDTLNILQDADGDTYWEMEETADEDIAHLYIAGAEVMQAKASEIVFNEAGDDRDFRIEGDTNANLFFLDAGNDRIGLGTNAPDGMLHITSSAKSREIIIGDNYNGANGWAGSRPAIMADNGTARWSIQNNSNMVLGTETNHNISFFTGQSERGGFNHTNANFTLGQGPTSTDASALLDLVSTTKGLGLPVWTTAQRDAISSPRDGLAGYNSDTDTLDVRSNGAWVSLATTVENDWTNSGAIDLTSGSPTSVTLFSGASDVNEIEIYLLNVSLDAANQPPMIQLGDPGGLETTGYTGRAVSILGGSSGFGATAFSSGFEVARDFNVAAADAITAVVRLVHMGSNVWVFHAWGDENGSDPLYWARGHKTLSAPLDRASLTTPGATAAFDGSSIAYARYR